MLDFKLKLTKELKPPGLPSRKLRLALEVLQTCMVRVNHKLSANQMLPPLFQ
jgi:hypothetical protein